MVAYPNDSQYENYNRINAIIIKRDGSKTVQRAIKVRLYVTMAQSTRLLPSDSLVLKPKLSVAVNKVRRILQFICRNRTDDGDPDTLFIFLFITVINSQGLRSPFALRHSHSGSSLRNLTDRESPSRNENCHKRLLHTIVCFSEYKFITWLLCVQR